MSDPPPANAFLPAIEQIDRHYALKVLVLCSSPLAAPNSTRTVLPGPWRNAAELEYVGPSHPSIATWNDYSIITYLVRAAITIPPRSDSRSDPWVVISSDDGSSTTTLPRGYRVPLLWLAKVQWESLKLLLTVAKPLWDLIKYDLLHLARLTTQFLSKARSEPRMKRRWRDPMFDRALTRFFNGWMGCSDMFIWDFYREFKDEEYKDDLLARRWSRKVSKGIRGFVITEQELLEGITAEQFTSGLVVDRANATFEWKVEPEGELLPPTFLSPARRKEDEEAAATNSRGSSPLSTDLGSDLEMVAEFSDPQAKASRPIRTRSMSSSISGLSPGTPKVAHLSRSDMSFPGSSASSRSRTPFRFDFTAPVKSRGRKRKIESVYSVSPLTSDSEDDSSGKGSNPHNSRPAQSAVPYGRAFAINSRIVIPRLKNPEMYSKPTTEAYSMTPIEQHPPVTLKTPRKGSTSETLSPRNAPKTPASLSQNYKLYAISSSPSTNPFDPTNPSTSIPPVP
ncbi:hypothetical protein MSAN_01406400 [Mycena sanguinolenta]|uniref:Uncharacterized protein n=1 Tax=Mycena sanguinolenta TaxID=230812 RepID=A0A8H6YA13_9AGAR|nr:hypothetical protein MSAN_01406400 [Mycena sanguinolenta]